MPLAARGATAVAITPTGTLRQALHADGATSVTLRPSMQWLVALRADGFTQAAILYIPDLFGAPTDDSHDPSGDPPMSNSPPIRLGLDLRGACSVLPPPLEF
jgi:hypothetical protein